MKYIVFGAGKLGMEALKYYGEDKVVAFCDNDICKHGTEYCGKPVVSFFEMLSMLNDNTIVVASRYQREMVDQLAEHNVKNYDIYIPRLTERLETVDREAIFYKKNAAICGVDDNSQHLVYWLFGKGVSRLFISDKNKENIGKKIGEMEVVDFCDIIDKVDVVVVGAERRSYAIQAFLNRYNNVGFQIINPYIRESYYLHDRLLVDEFNGKGTKTEEEWDEKTRRIIGYQNLDEYVETLISDLPLFDHVEVETINKCNGRCSFCPVSAGNDTRKREEMSEELFKKIVDELHELDYTGKFATFSNNEPFLDNRIVEFNKYAREMLPKARIHLFTNGTLLTVERVLEILPYLDELVIDNYTNDGSLIKSVKKIYDYGTDHSELSDKLTIVIRRENEILTTRGGNSPNRGNGVSYPDEKCVLPFKQMIIRPSGKVSLCCNDPYGEMTLGDVNSNTLVDIWYGKPFNVVRDQLLNGRKMIDHCKHCDTFIYY